MAITVEDYKRAYRTLDVVVTYLSPDKEEKQDTLHIKYRPITQGWLDGWAETSARLGKDLTRQTEETISAAFRDAMEIVNLNTNGHAPETMQGKALFLGALFSIINERMELTEEQKQEAKRLKASQLSNILITVDMLDPETKKQIEPTEDFLVTLDLEFLNEVGEGILKKTFRVKEN